MHRDPRRAHQLATERLAGDAISPRDRVLANWLLGRATYEIDGAPDAAPLLRSARQEAERMGLIGLAARISVSEAPVALALGHPERAFELLERAEPHVRGKELGRLVMQRALLHLNQGDLIGSLVDFDRSVELALEHDDEPALLRALINRGVLQLQRGELGAARSDFERCRVESTDSALDMIAAGAAHNLACLSGQEGDVPGALRWFGVAREEYAILGLPLRLVVTLELDSCSVLTTAGLLAEAIEGGRRARVAAMRSGDRVLIGDALLQLTHALRVAGHQDASTVGADAAESLASTGRLPLAALARYLSLNEHGAAVTELRDTIDLLDRHGWRSEADDVRLTLAMVDGDVTGAERTDLLRRVAAARRSGSWHRRVNGWLAEAHLRHDDPPGALRALRMGLRIAAEYRSSVAAADLRAHLSIRTERLVTLGTSIVRHRDTAELLDWADRAHAPSLEIGRPRPIDDPELTALLERLRGIRRSRLEIGPAADEELASLERLIRDRSRSSPAVSSTRRRPILGRLPEHFHHVDLLHLTPIDGTLVAIHVERGVARERDLGHTPDLASTIDHVRAGLARLARRRISPGAAAATRAAIDDVGASLDELLLDPASRSSTRPLIVVPAPELVGLPWSVLPSLRGRDWSLAPSAATAVRARTLPPSARAHAAFVAGPGLASSDDEIDRLARRWGASATTLTGAASTVSAVLDAIDGCRIAHVAAHGRFRSDSPMFSAIEMADGPLTVYDLDTLRSPPGTMVLSSCDLGQVAVRGAGDLLGTVAALLAIGVGRVVAPLTAVSDESMTTLMVDLHDRLVDGIEPSVALRDVRLAIGDAGDPGIGAAADAMVVVR